MHVKSAMCIVTAVLGLSTMALSAAPAEIAVAPAQATASQPVGYYYYGDDAYYFHRPACPYRYYYACWSDPYGRPHCGCWPGIGYYLFRYY